MNISKPKWEHNPMRKNPAGDVPSYLEDDQPFGKLFNALDLDQIMEDDREDRVTQLESQRNSQL